MNELKKCFFETGRNGVKRILRFRIQEKTKCYMKELT